MHAIRDMTSSVKECWTNPPPLRPLPLFCMYHWCPIATLQVADLIPTVIVRARCALNDSVCDMSFDEFKEAVRAMKGGRAKPEGPFPFIEGFNPHQQPNMPNSQYGCPAPAAAPLGYHGNNRPQYSPAGGVEGGAHAGAAPDSELDPYFFEGEDSIMGRSDVYLTKLLDDNNVIGDFPLLSSMDGSCLGTINIKLLPVDRIANDSKEPYFLALNIEQITLEKGPLTNLVDGSHSTWNTASAVSSWNPQSCAILGKIHLN